MPPGPQQILIGPQDLADKLGVSRSQIYAMKTAGKLPRCLEVGGPKWAVGEVEAWIAAGCLSQEDWEAHKALAKLPGKGAADGA